MRRRLAALGVLWVAASDAMAGSAILRLGPPSIGRGGSNPIGIPPTIVDAELGWLTEKGFESSLSITGLLFGQRAESHWGGYVTIGGGLVFSANGIGPGVHSAFGADFGCGFVCFNAEYKQAVGIANGSLISPYAIRLGVIKEF